jgi:hypothetical protein
MSDIKFLSNGSPRFKVDGESFQVKTGFNEMPSKFSKDPYYDLCKQGGIVKDFVSVSPTDKQQEDFDKQIQEERERADALQKELDELKSASAGQQSSDTDKPKKSTDTKSKE